MASFVVNSYELCNHLRAFFCHGYVQEARAFQTLIGDLFEAIGSPDCLAFRLYASAIIDRSKRDEILDYEQSSKKKRALLTAVEAQIQLQPSVYYEFVKVFSTDASMDFICRKMREQCSKSQLYACATSLMTN